MPAQQRFEFSIDERLGPFEPLPEAVWERVKDIPHPYAFAAADWLEGKDPKEGWLRYRSRSTYQRHRERLLTYGIDIASAQNVIKLPRAD